MTETIQRKETSASASSPTFLPLNNGNQSQIVAHSSVIPSDSQTVNPWKEALLAKREKGILKWSWKDRFVILLEGSLFFYQNPTDLTPKGVYHLLDCHVEETPEKKVKRKFVFSLKTPQEEIYFGAKDENERNEWMESVKRNLQKQPSPPPDKEFIRKTKLASVYISSKIIDNLLNLGTSGKIIRDAVSDETLVIIESLKSFLIQYLGAEKANKAEKRIVSIAAKVAVLYKEKQISKQYFESTRVPIRLMVSKVIDGYEIPFTFSAVELVDAIKTVQKILEQILRPYLTEKTLQKLAEVADLLSNEELVQEFFSKRKYKECELVGGTLRKLWDEGFL